MNTYLRQNEDQVKAAAAVLARAFKGGTFVVHPVETARAMISAAKSVSDPKRFYGRMQDGAQVALEFVDKGDICSAFDKDGNRYEAWTSWWRLSFAEPRGPQGERVLEDYVQIDRQIVDSAPDAAICRAQHDDAALKSMGVDLVGGLDEVDMFQSAAVARHVDFVRKAILAK